MSVLERVHGGYVHNRRVAVLSRHLAALLPAGAQVLDVGCGDGLLAAAIARLRPDVRIEGIDILVRDDTHIPVQEFDGTCIPLADNSVDTVLFVDVLHHTGDPMVLLREAGRVARQSVVLKDHTRNGLAAGATLRFMDRVGNARHGVALPYNYWAREQWQAAFTELQWNVGEWRTALGLYPWLASLLFERSLHFVARLDVA